MSPRHITLYGDEAISLDDFERAVKICRTSSYWDSQFEQAVSWFDSIWSFRGSYTKNNLTLMNAIGNSRIFESTDPRDAIFSLLGICYDGMELIPTPNYLQSIDKIMIDLTKALIKKYQNFDLILSSSMGRSRSSTLPSWVPNWLSEHISPQSYDVRYFSKPVPTPTQFIFSEFAARDLP